MTPMKVLNVIVVIITLEEMA